MHILSTSSFGLDGIDEPVDLGQTPGDIAMLSFSDSDLTAWANAWQVHKQDVSSVRLVSLAQLKHPMSVDLWIDKVAHHARVIFVRMLGGYDWWPYGLDQLGALARTRNIALAIVSGDGYSDPRLGEASTVSTSILADLDAYAAQSGPENLRNLLRYLGRMAGVDLEITPPQPVAKAGYYKAVLSPPYPKARVLVVFYRSMYLANDTAPVDALCAALTERGLWPVALFVTSLKDAASLEFLECALHEHQPAAIVTTTAFASSEAAITLFARFGVPVFQAVTAITKTTAWRDAPRGLGASDLAMHIVLPELDGRILAGALSFKSPLPTCPELSFTGYANVPQSDRVAQVASRVHRWINLSISKNNTKRIAVLMPDYPGAGGRAGYAIGLDVPESARVLMEDMAAQGYTVENVPQSARELMEMLSSIYSASPCFSLAEYKSLFAALPCDTQNTVLEAWGPPEDDSDVVNGAFQFKARAFGNVVVALPPDRGKAHDRRADYHDSARPPRHALIAFGLWLRHGFKADAVVHMGAHGTLEWLPGKAVALTGKCFPEVVMGDLPMIYPFLVSNPGEAAQAKRRLSAVTLGHMPPVQIGAEPSGPLKKLEQLVDEYALADGLDRRRRDMLAQLIIEEARASGLSVEAGISAVSCPDEALKRIDAWLCDLKELSLKDGQHVYGRAAVHDDTARVAAAHMERQNILKALEGWFIPPGPAGSPTRGRQDVMPTGRNMFTADPRTLPTPTAMDIARLASLEVIRHYRQIHGEMPRTLMLNLWGSAALRTGGEEIAQALAYLGCRPQWDAGTGRVTGAEVLPLAVLGRSRIDVSMRISGLFRDLFPVQIALLDAAVKAVAARDEDDEDNPIAAALRAGDQRLARLFGSATGGYGAGIEELLASGTYNSRADLGNAYMAASSYSYSGSNGEGSEAAEDFRTRVQNTDLHVHVADDAGRDLLEGSGDVSFIGGFAAASELLGRKASLMVLDSSRARTPKTRSLEQSIARIVRGRAINPRYIEGQMRHGPRGASDFAETADRLIAFAETTTAVPSVLIDAIFESYVTDERVWDFINRENPDAARAMRARFAFARQRGLWHPRRNDVEMWLSAEV
jgi:cobaltochelatase CobN